MTLPKAIFLARERMTQANNTKRATQMNKALRHRRVYWPLLISLTLIGAVGGFYAFVLSGTADALWVAGSTDTRTGAVKSISVYFHDRELYTWPSPTPSEIAFASALWVIGPLVLAVVGGAALGAFTAYLVSQWLFRRNSFITGSFH